MYFFACKPTIYKQVDAQTSVFRNPYHYFFFHLVKYFLLLEKCTQSYVLSIHFYKKNISFFVCVFFLSSFLFSYIILISYKYLPRTTVLILLLCHRFHISSSFSYFFFFIFFSSSSCSCSCCSSFSSSSSSYPVPAIFCPVLS